MRKLVNITAKSYISEIRVPRLCKRPTLEASWRVKMQDMGPHISPQWIKRVQNASQHVRLSWTRAPCASSARPASTILRRFCWAVQIPNPTLLAHVSIRPHLPARDQLEARYLSELRSLDWLRDSICAPSWCQTDVRYLSVSVRRPEILGLAKTRNSAPCKFINLLMLYCGDIVRPVYP